MKDKFSISRNPTNESDTYKGRAVLKGDGEILFWTLLRGEKRLLELAARLTSSQMRKIVGLRLVYDPSRNISGYLILNRDGGSFLLHR